MIARYAIPFFFFMGLIVAPIVFALLCRWLAPRKYWKKAALVCTIVIWALVGYGHLVGFSELEVHQIEYASADLPKAFDGYRIVQFSDIHVGSYIGANEGLGKRVVDSINAQQADLIVFTGDLENLRPEEVASRMNVLSQLHAKDGVYSILGNHDYPIYLDCDDATKAKYLEQTKQYEREMGWKLLLNSHDVIRRDSDSIIIAGMEDWGTVKRMPRKGDVKKTMAGVSKSDFVLMLQHDPTAWRPKILPECHAQLTLSGHTHGGQFQLFGWSPSSFTYDVWGGWDREGDRAMYVSTGVGALIPFRLNMPSEIVVITLKKK